MIFVRSEDPKPCDKSQPRETPKLKPVLFHCVHYGRDGHCEEFYWRKRRKAWREKEMHYKDKYHSSHSVPEPRSSLPCGELFVHSAPTRLSSFGGQFGTRRDVCSFVDRIVLSSRFPLHGTRVPPMRHERASWMGSDRVDFANPSFEQMARH